MTNVNLLRDIHAFLEHQKDYKLIIGPPHKNEAWELMDRIDAELAADEPKAEFDPLVQCRCGWMGKTSELKANPFSQGKLCPKCETSFRSITPVRTTGVKP